MMQALHSTSGFASEASPSGRPHTPPDTPVRPAKRRLERSDSPASTVGSIHPVETDSPAKKAAKRVAMEDSIKVEELAEGDVGYQTDIDIVYPEISSSESEYEDSTASDVSESETTGLTRRLSRLRCGDDREVDFEELRRVKHLEKRNAHRISKRSHSQSVKNDTEATDTDGLDDHDLKRSQRRLRRRVRGPRDVASEEPLRSSPEVGSTVDAAVEGETRDRHGNSGRHAVEGIAEWRPTDDMDVDAGK